MSTTLYTLTEKAGAYTFTPQATPPPPSATTRACYVSSIGGLALTDSLLVQQLPAIKAASYNTPKFPGQWPSSLAWCAANGMSAWITLGNFSNGGFQLTQSQAVTLAQQVWGVLPGCTFYLADEPPVGNTADANLILARAAAIKAAIPAAKCMIGYFDAASVSIYKGLDLIAGDIYVNKFNFNYALVTQLAQACKAAGIGYCGIAAAASDTAPMPTGAQLETWLQNIVAAGSSGFGVYSWGIGAEQGQYVAAVETIKT